MAGQVADRILIDTSVLIEHHRKVRKDQSWLYQLAGTGASLLLSPITVFEFMCGADAAKRGQFAAVLEAFEVAPVTREVAYRAAEVFGELRTANQLVPPSDLLIGATALVQGIPLATLNRKHFARIRGLVLVEQ